MKLLTYFLTAMLVSSYSTARSVAPADSILPAWQEGYLDIHHISTGRGNATFFLFPDGTTLLFDAGELDAASFHQRYAPLKVAPAQPDSSRSAGSWIASYIHQISPRERKVALDYAVISHFHADHYGTVTTRSETSKTGKFKLSGITQVGEHIPIRTLIDRNYPQYDYPVDLKQHLKDDVTFTNYLSFIACQMESNGLQAQSLIPGSTTQIRLQQNPAKYPTFLVRNVKANGTLWTGKDQHTRQLFTATQLLNRQGNYNENPLSLALKISYGKFDYFTGGDNTGLQGTGIPEWFDVETPMAKVVGRVEAMTLNHHGNRDATNEFFIHTLSPQVIVQQAWCSDQPGQEVLHRIVNKDLYADAAMPGIFATHLHPETQVTLGPWLSKNYQSLNGHVLIRVLPGGEQFYVYVLAEVADGLLVKRRHGPYQAK